MCQSQVPPGLGGLVWPLVHLPDLYITVTRGLSGLTALNLLLITLPLTKYLRAHRLDPFGDRRIELIDLKQLSTFLTI